MDLTHIGETCEGQRLRENRQIAITVANCRPEAAPLDLLPTIWFRNTWSWDHSQPKPILRQGDSVRGSPVIALNDLYYGQRYLYCQSPAQLLFTENDTNVQRLFSAVAASLYVKDAFHAYVVDGNQDAVNPAQHGTKAAAGARARAQP
jgi:hypothetical protein